MQKNSWLWDAFSWQGLRCVQRSLFWYQIIKKKKKIDIEFLYLEIFMLIVLPYKEEEAGERKARHLLSNMQFSKKLNRIFFSQFTKMSLWSLNFLIKQETTIFYSFFFFAAQIFPINHKIKKRRPSSSERSLLQKKQAV